MNWHALWAAEGLGGLRGGHTSSSYPSLPRGLWNAHGQWFCCTWQEAGAPSSEPHTPQGGSWLLPASLGLMAFNLEFNQCSFSLDSWMLWSGSESYDL